MSNHRTVFVLGAGASKPYGFPMGRELLMQIYRGSQCTPGHPDGPIYTQLRDADFDGQLLASFRDELFYSNQPSVDSFLENRREYVEVGKGAIAAALIPYENESMVFRNDWYEYLFQLIAKTPDTFRSSNLSIITFNYDRSLEYSLFKGLSASFGLSDADVIELLEAVPIVHVHGLLGQLPRLAEGGTRPYDTTVTPEIIQSSARQIRIIHEADDLGKEFGLAHGMIGAAKRVCFMGFGYHPANVERLRINDLCTGDLVGTTLGMEGAEISRAAKLFKSGLNAIHSDQNVHLFLRSYPIFD